MAIDVKLGDVPSSTLSDTSNFIFADGENVRKESYADVKNDMLGSANLATKAPKTKESINEMVQDILDTGGYGIISGGVVSTQIVPNMTVQVTVCPLRTSTGARQIANANTSLSITAADTTNARIDIVYVDSTGIIQYLQGTASATPVAPTTPVGGQLLAQINVTANATSITSANIIDKRKILISTDWLNAQLSENTQNITANTTNITGHIAKNITDIGGVHGLEISTGIFTPKLFGAENVGNNTYAVQTGFYYKIGNLVKCDIYLKLSTKDASMSGNARISGLPFVSKATTNKLVAGVISYVGNINLNTGYTAFGIYLANNANFIGLFTNGDNVSVLATNSTDISANSELILSITYEI